jgi:hypothetical protein
MDEKENPFDDGYTESEIIEDAYQSVKESKFDLAVTQIILVKRVHRDMAKKLHREGPTQPMDFTKEVLPFLTLASSVIEEKSTEIILNNLIQEDEQNVPFIQNEIANWSQGQREEALKQHGLIDEDLNVKMTAVRKARNKLVHEPDTLHSFEEVEYGSYTLPQIIDFALECAEELDDKTLKPHLESEG